MRNPSKPFWEFNRLPILLWIFLITTSIFFILYTEIPIRVFNESSIIENIEDGDSYLGDSENTIANTIVNTIGCKIPELPIQSKNMEKYFKYESNGIHCNKDIPALVQSNLTSLFLLKPSFEKYNISDAHLLHCCYEELIRKIPNGQRDNQYEFGVCFDFEESVDVKEEFVHVKCDYDSKRIYEDFFAFVPIKHRNITLDENHEKPNVLIIGLDGISRLNFHRQMPRYVRYLKEIDFVEFMGYNKIGDNTYPNLIAVLTGESAKNIQSTCRRSSKYFDNCNFIWNDFHDKDYLTSFGEDAAWMGIFNHEKYGFQQQPTDYMWGFFDHVAEKVLGNSPSTYITQCIGAREVYKMFVQYIHDFVLQMETRKTPYFGFFWSSTLSHDDLNKPRIGDEHYLTFVQTLYNEGYFENTVVVMMSDHGIRYGPFRSTNQGRTEESLPFLFVRLPRTFKEKYPLASSNLERNSRMLTTPFDLHATLIDISSPLHLKDEFIAKAQRKPKTKHGLSLFHQIQPTRTCEDAGIDYHWCTCIYSNATKITTEIKELAEFTTNYMNQILQGYVKCAKLQLKEVSKAEILTRSRKKNKVPELSTKYFLINFQTLPGDGLFEAIVKQMDITNMEIIGSISRLNFYGNQSACITDLHLKLYCYCDGRNGTE